MNIKAGGVEERLRRLDERRERILDAARQQPQPHEKGGLVAFTCQQLWDETEMFLRVCFDQRDVHMYFVCVSDVCLEPADGTVQSGRFLNVSYRFHGKPVESIKLMFLDPARRVKGRPPRPSSTLPTMMFMMLKGSVR